jgi:hypothetical protein
MKRLLLPLVFGLVCFLGFLIAATPARLVYDLALRPAGIEAGLVHGRIWDARVSRIRLGDLTIANARAQLEPASLLTGGARFNFSLADPALRAEGVAVLRAGGARLQDVSGVIRLDQIMPELAIVAPDEVLQFDVETLALDGDGRCEAASGQALTPALIALGERYGVDLPVLRFDLLCAGDWVGADLSGASEAVSVSGRLRFGEQGLEGRIEARSTVNNVIAALSFAGFDQVDQGVFALTLPLPEEG